MCFLRGRWVYTVQERVRACPEGNDDDGFGCVRSPRGECGQPQSIACSLLGLHQSRAPAFNTMIEHRNRRISNNLGSGMPFNNTFGWSRHLWVVVVVKGLCQYLSSKFLAMAVIADLTFYRRVTQHLLLSLQLLIPD